MRALLKPVVWVCLFFFAYQSTYAQALKIMSYNCRMSGEMTGYSVKTSWFWTILKAATVATPPAPIISTLLIYNLIFFMFIILMFILFHLPKSPGHS